MSKKIVFEDAERLISASKADPSGETGNAPARKRRKKKQKLHKEETPEKCPQNSLNPEKSSTNPIKPLKSRLSHTPRNVFFNSDDSDGSDGSDGSNLKSLGISGPSGSAESARTLLETRKRLPVYQSRDSVLRYIRDNPTTIIVGETGSGKSTQIPQFLVSEFGMSVAVTQPRRVAAINLARRVSEEFGCRLGTIVGFSVRFQHATSPQTRLKYATDGMLLREIATDANLSRYDAIVLDEVHERSVVTDLLLGFLKQLQTQRAASAHPLKLVVMSATLDAEAFAEFFRAPVVVVQGRMFPVERNYLAAPPDDVLDATIRTVAQINSAEPPGDVLVFLPGQEEIEQCLSVLEACAPHLPREAPRLLPMPLYAALPPAEQLRVFAAPPLRHRKVILATNIAETSVTVPGVRFVVDSGLRKVKIWKPELGLATLFTTAVSQASARQRMGRAGREGPGKCFRLYTEAAFAALPPQTEPEIMRSDVASPVLLLKTLGVADVLRWPWFQPPGRSAILAALTGLFALGALDSGGAVTALGRRMAQLPLAPSLAAILVRASEVHVLSAVIDIVACLSVDNLVMSPPADRRDAVNAARRRRFPLGAQFGDLVMLWELWRGYRELSGAERKEWCREVAVSARGMQAVAQVRRQIAGYMRGQGGVEAEAEAEADENRNKAEKIDGKAEKIAEDESNIHKSSTGEIPEYGNSSELDVEAVLKCFLIGYIGNTAIGLPDRSYRTLASNRLISVHPSSMMFGSRAEAIMYTEYVSGVAEAEAG